MSNVVLSIIVPTRNESGNIRPLAERVAAALSGITSYELIFVDDSNDDTPIKIAAVKDIDARIRLLHRYTSNGLSGAVLDGFRISRGRYLVVMDADLQHPPELLPKIFWTLQGGADIVLPSRYVNGGRDGGLSPIRKFVSWSARTIGKLFIPGLRGLTDITSGFFGLHRSVIENAHIRPRGWKILIDVLAKGTYTSVKEIPYQFAQRHTGESKLDSSVSLAYLAQVVSLAHESESMRFIKFCIVGLSGVAINMAVFWDFQHALFDGVVSSVFASLIAMLWNYFFNSIFTWAEWMNVGRLVRFLRFVSYISVSLLGVVTTTSIYGALSDSIPHLYAQFFGIAGTAIWTYLVHDNLTWGHKKAKNRKTANSSIN